MKLSPNTSKVVQFSACITHTHVGVNEVLESLSVNLPSDGDSEGAVTTRGRVTLVPRKHLQ